MLSDIQNNLLKMQNDLNAITVNSAVTSSTIADLLSVLSDDDADIAYVMAEAHIGIVRLGVTLDNLLTAFEKFADTSAELKEIMDAKG